MYDFRVCSKSESAVIYIIFFIGFYSAEGGLLINSLFFQRCPETLVIKGIRFTWSKNMFTKYYAYFVAVYVYISYYCSAEILTREPDTAFK